MLVFEERGNRNTRRKPLGAEPRTNKLNAHMTPDLEIEPGHNGGGGGGGYQIQVPSPNLAQIPGHSLTLVQIPVTKSKTPEPDPRAVNPIFTV